MSNRLIVDPADNRVAPAYDPFWDEKPTRREMQKAFNKLGTNDAELMAMVDTLNLVVNFLCERLEVKKEEIDAYVARKAEEITKLRAAQDALKGPDKDREDA